MLPFTKAAASALPYLLALFIVAAGCASTEAPETNAGNRPTAAGFVPVEPDRTCPSPAPEWDCLTPYPSNFHRMAGEGGQPQMVLPKTGVPVTTEGERVDLISPRGLAGTSIMPQLIVHIPGGIDDDPLVFHEEDTALSLKAESSPTLLIDADTGEAVPHFAEIDPVPDKVAHRALVLRPLAPLQWAHRYVVVLHGLKHADGKPVSRSQTFERIITGAAKTGTLGKQAAYYAAHILPVTDDAGVAREAITLAWDFTTSPAKPARGRVKAMADDALSKVAAKSVGAVAITSTKTKPNKEAAYWIKGTVTVPAYVDAEKHPSFHVSTTATGTFTLPFRLLVTKAAETTLKAGGTPPVVIMGHGFFGEADELNSGGYRRIAQAAGAVALGIDWWGLSKSDASSVVVALVGKLAPVAALVDRLEQGLVNVVTLAALTRQKAAPNTLTGLTLPGTDIHILQPSAHLGYFGCSLGHILGASAVALSPDIERAAIQVGGAGFGLIMSRSMPFGGLQGVLGGRFSDHGQTLLAVNQLAELLAPIDPISWGKETVTRTSGATRPVLIHAGIADTSVPYLSAEVHARALGLPLLTPSSQTVWGLSEQPAGKSANGLVQIDYGVPDPTVLAIAPKKANKVHNGIRGLAPVIAQVGAFLRGETVPAACSGACDPE
ncbi:MAG: hypothetical protein KC502_16605 [Myxococcales bacterium]|nr:hypothetical protein [Myxococcales bacterium]